MFQADRPVAIIDAVIEEHEVKFYCLLDNSILGKLFKIIDLVFP